MSVEAARDAVETVKLIALLINVVLIGAAIILMRDLERNARCRYCDHCRDAIRREKEEQAKKRHAAFHAYTDRNPSACTDDDCKGRK